MDESSPRIFILEDEALVAMDLSVELEDHGYEVLGPAMTVKMAADILTTMKPDFAVLDANVGGELPSIIAQDLSERGVPFVYVSGYGQDYITKHLPPAPLLPKPVQIRSLIDEIKSALGR